MLHFLHVLLFYFSPFMECGVIYFVLGFYFLPHKEQTYNELQRVIILKINCRYSNSDLLEAGGANQLLLVSPHLQEAVLGTLGIQGPHQVTVETPRSPSSQRTWKNLSRWPPISLDCPSYEPPAMSTW